MDTIVKVFLVIVGVLVVVLCIGNLITGISGADQKEAEKEAAQWASSLGIEVKGVSCAKTDTDGDGYVSCTVNSISGIQIIECSKAITINSGCRAPKFRTNNPGTW